MSYQEVFAISAAGMDVERTRVDVAALNLANANTVVSADGRGYQTLRVIARSSVSTQTQDPAAVFAGLVEQGLPRPSADVVASDQPTRRVHDPSHPLADGRGFVEYPGVDSATEMMTFMSAMRAYEANVAAMNMTRTLALKALEIGGQS
jgi:flagellar basal-body rod protein FlgC